MKICIASDHGGFDLKEVIKDYLVENDVEVIDCGCFNKERVDYPVFAVKAAKLVQNGECEYGVLVCTTGIGMSIVGNKFKGVRAALVTNLESAALTRQHNNSNIICLGAKFTTNEEGIEYVKTFINEEFTYGRHLDRVNMIKEVEENE